MVPLSIRVPPKLHKKLYALQKKRPHLTMNALINEMLLSEIARTAEPSGVKK